MKRISLSIALILSSVSVSVSAGEDLSAILLMGVDNADDKDHLALMKDENSECLIHVTINQKSIFATRKVCQKLGGQIIIDQSISLGATTEMSPIHAGTKIHLTRLE